MSKTLVGGLMAVALMVGCGDQAHVTTLAWYRVPCEGPFPRMCPVERGADGQTEFVYDQINGYTHVWGVEADVRYHVEAGPAAADAVDTWEIDHVEATREVEVGATAVWHVDGQGLAFTAVGDHVELLGQAVACDATLCAQLTAVPAGTRMLVDIIYTGDPSAPLRATGLRPAP